MQHSQQVSRSSVATTFTDSAATLSVIAPISPISSASEHSYRTPRGMIRRRPAIAKPPQNNGKRRDLAPKRLLTKATMLKPSEHSITFNQSKRRKKPENNVTAGTTNAAASALHPTKDTQIRPRGSLWPDRATPNRSQEIAMSRTGARKSTH
jgi:hypothetical protein